MQHLMKVFLHEISQIKYQLLKLCAFIHFIQKIDTQGLCAPGTEVDMGWGWDTPESKENKVPSLKVSTCQGVGRTEWQQIKLCDIMARDWGAA